MVAVIGIRVFVSFVCLESHVGFDLKYTAMHINTSIAINSVICICTLHISRCTQAITRYMSTYIYMTILTKTSNYTSLRITMYMYGHIHIFYRHISHTHKQSYISQLFGCIHWRTSFQ